MLSGRLRRLPDLLPHAVLQGEVLQRAVLP
jgi:hypothetical protein